MIIFRLVRNFSISESELQIMMFVINLNFFGFQLAQSSLQKQNTDVKIWLLHLPVFLTVLVLFGLSFNDISYSKRTALKYLSSSRFGKHNIEANFCTLVHACGYAACQVFPKFSSLICWWAVIICTNEFSMQASVYFYFNWVFDQAQLPPQIICTLEDTRHTEANLHYE